jgi:3-phosphoshikimate 1-carboxyvinyltransferase
MGLPTLIEIVPLDSPVQAQVTVPGSKSITNRALILAALAQGETVLEGALWSEDTQVMVDALRKLGFEIRVEPDADEFCNRTITVNGAGGRIPRGGTQQDPLEIFVGNAGTAARFLAALVCLGVGVYRLYGVARMHERPQAELFEALRELGYRIEAEHDNDKLPARFMGLADTSGVTPKVAGKPGQVVYLGGRIASVSIESSSQFASALLLCSGVGGWTIRVSGENAEESPYVAMTVELMKVFPKQGGRFRIEPDASSGSYFLGAGALVLQSPSKMEYSAQFGTKVETSYLSRVEVPNWPHSGWQIDERFPKVVLLSEPLHLGLLLGGDERLGKRADILQSFAPTVEISRIRDLGDSIMMGIVLAPFALKPIRFTELGRLRMQECERVIALRTELTKCGAEVIESRDSLEVLPSKLHGAEIDTYNDHRMAMCFAILGLKVPGIKIRNPACVKKTFPNFFQKLATPPPQGLGAIILDGLTRRRLTSEELFAE